MRRVVAILTVFFQLTGAPLAIAAEGVAKPPAEAAPKEPFGAGDITGVFMKAGEEMKKLDTTVSGDCSTACQEYKNETSDQKISEACGDPKKGVHSEWESCRNRIQARYGQLGPYCEMIDRSNEAFS